MIPKDVINQFGLHNTFLHDCYKQIAALAQCIHNILLMSEVKQCRAWSVLGWETAWEHWVLLASF